MFSEAIKLAESWDADGNISLEEFEAGKFITESLDEWAYNFSALADEYEAKRESLLDIIGFDALCAFCNVEGYHTSEEHHAELGVDKSK